MKYTCYNGFTMKINFFKYKKFKGGGCAYKILGRATLIWTLPIAPSVSDKSSFEFALTAELKK